MALVYTVTNAHSMGNLRAVHGTFTSAAGDSGGDIAYGTHGLNYIVDYTISLDTGGLNTLRPKTTVSSGTITWTVDDTRGYSGKFYVLGR